MGLAHCPRTLRAWIAVAARWKLEIAAIVGFWELLIELAELGRQLDGVQQLLGPLPLQISEPVRAIIYIVELIFKGTLPRDEPVPVDALLDDLLVEEGVAAGPHSRIWLDDHSYEHVEF